MFSKLKDYSFAKRLADECAQSDNFTQTYSYLRKMPDSQYFGNFDKTLLLRCITLLESIDDAEKLYYEMHERKEAIERKEDAESLDQFVKLVLNHLERNIEFCNNIHGFSNALRIRNIIDGLISLLSQKTLAFGILNEEIDEMFERAVDEEYSESDTFETRVEIFHEHVAFMKVSTNVIDKQSVMERSFRYVLVSLATPKQAVMLCRTYASNDCRRFIFDKELTERCLEVIRSYVNSGLIDDKELTKIYLEIPLYVNFLPFLLLDDIYEIASEITIFELYDEMVARNHKMQDYVLRKILDFSRKNALSKAAK